MLTAKNREKREFLLSEFKLTMIGLPFFILISSTVALYIWVWGSEPLLWGVSRFFSFVCIPIVLMGLFLNEFFFRLTLAILGKFPMSKFWYGFNLNQLMKCGDREIPAGISYFRLAMVIPHAILGLFPLVLGLSINYSSVFIFGYLFTLASIGDITLLWESRHVKSTVGVSEHPTREGILLIEEE